MYGIETSIHLIRSGNTIVTNGIGGKKEMSCSSYMKKTSNGNIDITPHIGHVHTKDADWQGRGIKTQVPVSLANDRTGERFRIDVHKTPIGEIAKKHSEMLK